jgi:signal transduction histidine kinase
MRGAAVPGVAAARAIGLPRWPRLVLLHCMICPPAAVLFYTAFWPMWRDRPLLALGSLLLSMGLLCVGVLLLEEPGQHGSAGMLMAAAALLTVGWLSIWGTGPLPLISVPASSAGTIIAAWAMFRYQSTPRVRRVSNRYFAVMLAFILAGQAVSVAASRPQWNGFSATAWWPMLTADRGLFDAANNVVAVAGVGFTVSYMVLWLVRWRRSHGIARRLALPVALAVPVSCLVIMAELAASVAKAGPHAMNVIYTVEAFAEITVPAAFALSVAQRRFTRTRITDLLLRLRGPERVSLITGALRDVLEDPTLEVTGWAPRSAGSAPVGFPAPASAPASAGFPGPAPAGPLAPDKGSNGQRLRLPVTASSGERLAEIVADPALSASDDLVRAAVAATALTLENAQLEAALEDRLREVSESRLRIIQAGMAERRRLEQDLHDGIQQGLQGLHVMLAAAESDADPAAATLIARIGAELAQVIDELRDLAHGVHPGVLSQVGLAEAVRTMAGRYTVAIDVDLPAGRFGDDTELTAYYLIAESITNAIKHAGAARITVQGEKSGGWLRITVSDDGKGGATAEAGTGISGILDRVRGIGGEAELHSPPGHGTEIRARVPCG